MLRLWNMKENAAKKWRSRAWIIDPKATNLIIKTEAKLEIIDIEDSNLNFHRLLQSYPQYFEAVTDMEQFGF